jgi:ribosomal protein L20A (L18A)
LKKKLEEVDKSLANLTKMRREKIQISKIRNVKSEIITNTTERDCGVLLETISQ